MFHVKLPGSSAVVHVAYRPKYGPFWPGPVVGLRWPMKCPRCRSGLFRRVHTGRSGKEQRQKPPPGGRPFEYLFGPIHSGPAMHFPADDHFFLGTFHRGSDVCAFQGLEYRRERDGDRSCGCRGFSVPIRETGVGSRRFFVEAEIVCQLPPDDKFFEKCP